MKKKYGIIVVLVIIATICIDFRNISFESFADRTDTTHVAYWNGQYIYYDSGGKIYLMGDDFEKRELTQIDNICDIACNEKYIYCLTRNEIVQIDYNGNPLHTVQFETFGDFDTLDLPNDDDLYANDEYLYFRMCNWLAVYHASDLSSIPLRELNWKKQIIGYDDVDDEFSYLKSEDLNDSLWLEYREYFGVKDVPYFWIRDKMTQPEEGATFYLISDETGANLFNSGNLCYWKGDFLIVTNKIEKVNSNGKLEKIDDYYFSELGDYWVRPPYFISTKIVNDKLLINGTCFKNHEYEGRAYAHTGDVIVFVDPEKLVVTDEVYTPSGYQVVYSNDEEYIAYHNGSLQWFDISSGECLRKEKISRCWNYCSYRLEVCNQKIFLYYKDKLCDCIDL